MHPGTLNSELRSREGEAPSGFAGGGGDASPYKMNPLELAQFNFVREINAQGGEIYLVGGNVRDYFLKKEYKDFDLLVCKLSLNSLESILKNHGWCNRVGRSFGVLKFKDKKNPNFEIDISLPRIEKSTGQGHKDFEVDFDPNIPVERDLARRDFTINAMAMNLTTQSLIDPFKGQEDLKNKILRQVFNEAFVEDPLRLLRAVQFAARFGLQVEKNTLLAMKQNSVSIKTVSKERITQEIGKLFLAEKPSIGFDLMRKTGILPHIFPFVDDMIGILQPKKKNQDVYDHTMQVLDASKSALELDKPGNLDLMFSALLHDAGKPLTVRVDPITKETTFFGHQNTSKRIAKKWLRDFKVSILGIDTDKVLNLVHNHMFETKAFYSDRAIRRFVNKIGKENIFDLIDLRIADKKGGRFPDSMKGILNLRSRIQDELAKKPPFGAKDLAVNGHDIINMGFPASPIIGKIQKFLIEKVLDEPELNNKETLIRLIEENFKNDIKK